MHVVFVGAVITVVPNKTHSVKRDQPMERLTIRETWLVQGQFGAPDYGALTSVEAPSGMIPGEMLSWAQTIKPRPQKEILTRYRRAICKYASRVVFTGPRLILSLFIFFLPFIKMTSNKSRSKECSIFMTSARV